MNNAVRPFSAVSPALHPSIRLVLFHFKLYTFFSLSLMFLHRYPPSFAARAQLTLFLLSDSAKAMLHFRELLSPTFSLLTPILSLLFRILYQCFPSLRIYLPFFDLLLFPLTYFCFSHIVHLFAIDILGDRCQPTICALFVLLPFNVYVSPTPSVCCARQNIK